MFDGKTAESLYDNSCLTIGHIQYSYYASNGSRMVEILQRRMVFYLVLLTYHTKELIGIFDLLDKFKRKGAFYGNRNHNARKQHHVPQRENGDNRIILYVKYTSDITIIVCNQRYRRINVGLGHLECIIVSNV